MSQPVPIVFPDKTKNASSARLIELDFFDHVANFWEPGQQYAANDIVRPRKPTGFAYQAGAAGQSGGEEPAWPGLAATVADGSITWTGIVAGASGVTAITAPVVTIAQAGELSAGTATVVNGKATATQVNFTLSTGVPGTTYEVSVQVTAGGQTLLGVFKVHVK